MSKTDSANNDNGHATSKLFQILEDALLQADALGQQLVAIHIQTAIEVLRPQRDAYPIA